MASDQTRGQRGTPPSQGGRFKTQPHVESDVSLGDELPGGTDWPRIAWEEHDWRPSISPELMTRARREMFRGPYHCAVVPEIAGLTPLLPSSVATASEEATNAIARFDAEMGAEVAPFAAILLRSESAASSQIENLTCGAKQIALAELGSRDKRNAAQIVGNVEAMNAAIDLAERFDKDAILAVHSALMEGHADDIAGRWRRDQVWIGGSSLGPHGAMYVAPTPEHVPALMSDLVGFARRTDIPLLTQAAIAHAQFETIHPFPDGNGRTGRALIHSMLRGHGLTRNITVPVSAGLLTDTGRYFDTLTAYRDGDAAPIVDRMADASFSAIANGAQLVRDLRGVRASWDDQVKARRDSTAWRLADVLIRHPVVDSPTVARELGIKIENVRRAVNPLVDAGVLREFTGFSRNRMWDAKPSPRPSTIRCASWSPPPRVVGLRTVTNRDAAVEHGVGGAADHWRCRTGFGDWSFGEPGPNFLSRPDRPAVADRQRQRPSLLLTASGSKLARSKSSAALSPSQPSRSSCSGTSGSPRISASSA